MTESNENRSTPLGIKLHCGGMFVVFSVILLGAFIYLLVPIAGTTTAAFALIPFCLLEYFVLYGLWTLKRWGCGVSLLNHVVGAVINIPPLLAGVDSGAIIAIGVNVLLFFYLYSSRE